VSTTANPDRTAASVALSGPHGAVEATAGSDEWHIQKTHAGLDGSKDCWACQVERGEIPSLAEQVRAAAADRDDARESAASILADSANIARELAAARAEIAAQAATITELRAAVSEGLRQIQLVSEAGQEIIAEKDRELAEAQLEATKWADWEPATQWGFIALNTGEFVHHGDEGQARALAAVVKRPLMQRPTLLGPVTPVEAPPRGPVQAVKETTE